MKGLVFLLPSTADIFDLLQSMPEYQIMEGYKAARLLYINKNPDLSQLIAPTILSMGHSLDTTHHQDTLKLDCGPLPYELLLIHQDNTELTTIHWLKEVQRTNPDLAFLLLLHESELGLTSEILSLHLCSYIVLDREEKYLLQLPAIVSGLLDRQQLTKNIHNTDKSLERQAEIMKSIFDAAPVEIYLKNTNREYQWVNKQWQKHYAQTNKTAVGLTSHNIIPAKLADVSKANDLSVLKTGLPTEETQIVETTLGVRSLRTLRFPIKDTLGSITGIGVIALDETEKNKTEAILESIFGDASICIALHAPDGNRRVNVNKAFCKFLGFSRQELLDEPYELRTHPDDLEESLRFRRELAEGKRKNLLFEKRYIHKDGHYLWGSVSTHVIRGDDKKILYYISFIQDITERKEAAKEILAWQHRLSLATEGAGIGVWDWNITEGNVFWDAQTRKLFGLSPDIENITYEIWSQSLHPDDTERASKAFDDALAGNGEYNTQFRVIHPNGDVRTLRAKAYILQGNDGKAARMVGINWDITENVAMEEQIRRSQKMEAVGQLTGGVAHDFNNILGIVMGHLELIEEKVSDNPDLLRLLAPALIGIRRGAQLTNKLLSFSGKMVAETETTQVNHLIRKMQDLIAKSLTVSIDVSLKLEEDLWLTDIDPGDLQDAILNLSLNARDAMPDGGTLVIETANKELDADFVRLNPNARAGDFILITVADTGSGMSSEVMERLYEPFFTTKDLGRGTGLGLSMVFGFIERSNGFVTHHSEQGIGTTFNIYLPRSFSHTQTIDTETENKSAPPGGRETILVVDDEEALADLAIENLKILGYNTHKATNGKQALEILEKIADIDLIFSDVVMPGEYDGYQLSQAAYQLKPDIAIILTSGFTNSREARFKDEETSIATLAANILNKPYTRHELARAIRKSLDKTNN